MHGCLPLHILHVADGEDHMLYLCIDVGVSEDDVDG
jgi:hypothetical protein